MNDFDGELSIEPIVGVRVFDIDEHGRLRGVSYDDVWTPGENVSVCHVPPAREALRRAEEEWAYRAAVRQYESDLLEWRTRKASGSSLSKWLRDVNATCDQEPQPPKREDFFRQLGDEPIHNRAECKCGFWAFYAPSGDYDSETRVYAVIEGYGEVTIGSKGFRAQKARILAVSLPDLLDGGSDRAAYLQSLVRRNYPDVRTFAYLHQMLEAVPPSRQPEGPESEGFWDQPERHPHGWAAGGYVSNATSSLTHPLRQQMLNMYANPTRFIAGMGGQ